MFGYHFGYQMAYFSLHYQNEKSWSDKIYGNLVLGQTPEVLDIPISMPYMPDQSGFSESNSTFEKDGRVYRVIQQRYHQDTLQIVYVPDSGKESLKNLLADWFQAQDDRSNPTPGISVPHPDFKPYIPHETELPIAAPCSSLGAASPVYTALLPSDQARSLLSPPPEAV